MENKINEYWLLWPALFFNVISYIIFYSIHDTIVTCLSNLCSIVITVYLGSTVLNRIRQSDIQKEKNEKVIMLLNKFGNLNIKITSWSIQYLTLTTINLPSNILSLEEMKKKNEIIELHLDLISNLEHIQTEYNNELNHCLFDEINNKLTSCACHPMSQNNPNLINKLDEIDSKIRLYLSAIYKKL